MNDKSGVLFITYYIPPKNAIASMRTGGLSRHLSQRGWDVVVLTADHSSSEESTYNVVDAESPSPLVTRIIEDYKSYVGYYRAETEEDQTTEEKRKKPLFKKGVENIFKPIVKFARDEIIHYPDKQKLWEDNAVIAGDNIIENRNISCIISSSGPFTCHRIASRLCKKYNIPWIADYRDPWTQGAYRDRTIIREFFERRMEKKVIEPASRIITVSDPIADMLSNLHNKKVKTIRNGFDEGQYPAQELRDKFTIMYPGQFYRGKRNPELLFSALSKVYEEVPRDEIQIEFYKPVEPWVHNLADNYGIKDCIIVSDRVDRSTILKRERESHCLLSLHWNDERSKGYYTGKIFEYLGARRPIAAITPPTVVNKLLDETGAGESFYDSAELADWIYKQYRQFKETGEVKYSVVESSWEKYSQQRMADEFERTIYEVVDSHR